ncbi:hypothetical protein IMG5_033320, partial [Ichthyophthirius multifiliis]
MSGIQIHTKFFRTFKVNIESECKFFTIEGHCKSQGCAVCQCDDNNIPIPWKKTDLVHTENYHNSNIIEKDTNEDEYFWRVEEFEKDEGTYVDLKTNVEAYTGYQGQKIWKLIYEENCFKGEEKDMCKEERTLNRILSGLHASVSTQLCELYLNDFEQKNKNYVPNWPLYFQKVGDYHERIQNLLFYYTVLLRAINRADKVLRNYDYNTGDFVEDFNVKTIINDILDITTLQCDHPFQEKDFFTSIRGKQAKIYYQNYIHNITRIMDCVECGKCKVFGKMQVYGIGVALKILFSGDSTVQIQNLRRNEIITLVNAFVKCASSVEIIENMFFRKYNFYKSLGLAIFSSVMTFLLFLIFAFYFKD